MILISHRGNINGKNPERENSPEYISEAIEAGYHVEVDVYEHNDKLYLGHDKPQYQIEISFLKNDKLWCHCKNAKALEKLVTADVHCFFHKTDDVVMTSKGYMWVFPGKPALEGSIYVLPEITQYSKEDLRKCAGICSDYVATYREL